MIIGGIDPGKEGGICLLDAKGQIIKLQTLKTTVVRSFLQDGGCKILYVEKAQSMGKESGKASGKAMFSYGRDYGYMLGTLVGSGIDINFVTPAVWTALLHKKSPVPSSFPKAASLNVARQFWPEQTWLETPRCRNPHDGLFEAALIAYYGWLAENERRGLFQK